MTELKLRNFTVYILPLEMICGLMNKETAATNMHPHEPIFSITRDFCEKGVMLLCSLAPHLPL